MEINEIMPEPVESENIGVCEHCQQEIYEWDSFYECEENKDIIFCCQRCVVEYYTVYRNY